MSNKISDEYLALLRNSKRQAEMARTICEFVERNLAVTYKLQGEDKVDLETGEIARATTTEDQKVRKIG